VERKVARNSLLHIAATVSRKHKRNSAMDNEIKMGIKNIKEKKEIPYSKFL
jgi:hypothetical protein